MKNMILIPLTDICMPIPNQGQLVNTHMS